MQNVMEERWREYTTSTWGLPVRLFASGLPVFGGSVALSRIRPDARLPVEWHLPRLAAR
ncbi:hypothetical protein [Paraburkholderia aromaticivorans]|uniref:hypothetical protein n=1 Tax=Paraburkholderia aromaticivorans TaxID=2026199 RepID=UPI001980D5D9|nr:hypothetical protein [Paraburkholderia aromaticivorans]